MRVNEVDPFAVENQKLNKDDLKLVNLDGDDDDDDDNTDYYGSEDEEDEETEY